MKISYVTPLSFFFCILLSAAPSLRAQVDSADQVDQVVNQTEVTALSEDSAVTEGVTKEEAILNDGTAQVQINLSKAPACSGWLFPKYSDVVAPAITLHIGQKMVLSIHSSGNVKSYAGIYDFCLEKPDSLSTLELETSHDVNLASQNLPYKQRGSFFALASYCKSWTASTPGDETIVFDGIGYNLNYYGASSYHFKVKVPVKVVDDTSALR